MQKDKVKVGDMIIYNYLGSEKIKGRVIEKLKDKVKIEIGICHKKSEDIYFDRVTCKYSDLLPFSELDKK